jgi:hypothetical protein
MNAKGRVLILFTKPDGRHAIGFVNSWLVGKPDESRPITSHGRFPRLSGGDYSAWVRDAEIIWPAIAL